MPASALSRKIAEAVWRDWEYCGDFNAPPMDEEDAAHLADLIRDAGVGELEEQLAQFLRQDEQRSTEHGELLLERAALAQRIEAAVALHKPFQSPRCSACDQKYPCPTVRILRGEP